MAYRSLELTLISAKDLNDVNVFSKMDVYAVASIAGDHRSQRTPTDKDGGKNPSWNAALRFTIPADPAAASRLVLHVLLRSERTLGDRDIGEVHIPVKELLDAGGPSGGKQFVTYQVRKLSSGKAKGVLNLSYNFLDSPVAEKAAAAPPPMAYPDPAKLAPPPPVAYPAPPPAAYPAPPPVAYPAPPPVASSAPPPPGYTPTSEKAGKHDKPVTAYPAAAGTSAGYPPPSSSYPPAGPSGSYPPPGGYPPYPQQQPYYAQPAPGYGYPPPPAGYGYPPPPPAGYGYGAPQAVKPQKKKNGFGGAGLGMGLLGGALGGLLIGDMLSDAGSYDAGYDAGFDDAGGFDF